MRRSLKIRDKYIECSQNGELDMCDELAILEYLVKRFNLTSASDYAKQVGISHVAVHKKIKEGKVSFITIGNKNFIIN
jgi:DNA-binding Xre family transcriptional regulator